MRSFGGEVELVPSFLELAVSLVLLGGVNRYLREATKNGSLGRNSLIGIRTRVTKASDLAWQRGHRAAGPWLLAASWVGFLFAGLTICVLIVQILAELDSPAGLVVPGAGFLGVVVLALISAKKANEAGRSAHEEFGEHR